MKKSKLLMVIAMLLVCAMVLVGCSNDSDDSKTSKSKSSTKKVQELELGEEWVVDGQWKLKIDSVVSTSERNQFSDKNPEQVVTVTYSYENLGYEAELGISNGLCFYLEPNINATVVDAEGEVAYSYPGEIIKTPQDTPVGAKCLGAQSCIGLNNKSDEITMTISQYDENGDEQKVKYTLKVD